MVGFILVLISVCVTTVFAFLAGSNGVEAFYATSISLYLILVWFSMQLVKHLYSMKVWLIVKLILSAALLAFLLIALLITVASWSIDTSQPVNGWLVLLGIAPFVIPRLGVYRKMKSFDKLSAGLLISFFSMILFYIASSIFQKNLDDVQNFVLVVVVQFQFIFTYIALQTNYVERSISFVLSVCRKIGLKYGVGRLYIILFTAGLPFLVPLFTLLYLASQ